MALRPRRSHAVHRPRHRGQALVEFALILPLMLLLTLGVVDLARIFSSYIALTDGVREAALYASEGTNNTKWCSTDPGAVECPPGTQPANRAPGTDNIAFQINSAGLDVTGIDMLDPVCNPSPCDWTTDSTITIESSYKMDLLTPIVSELFGQDVLVKAKTTAKVLP